jgi:hypothetical protein
VLEVVVFDRSACLARQIAQGGSMRALRRTLTGMTIFACFANFFFQSTVPTTQLTA